MVVSNDIFRGDNPQMGGGGHDPSTIYAPANICIRNASS